MNAEKSIKLFGGTLISLLAIFWTIVVSVHPNPLFRIFMFSIGFGSTALGLVQPFIWLAKSVDCEESRTKEALCA